MRSPSRFLAVVALSLGSIAPVHAAYSPASVFVPDSGIGMVSEYASIIPKWGEDNATIDIPTSSTNETNLVWTFWGHTRFDPAEWPQGPGARVSVTLVAETSVTVRVSSFVRAGNWSAPAAGPSVTLPAGKPVTLLVPLPPAPSEPVEILRILLEAGDTMPALTITQWSVGTDPGLAAAAR